MNAFIDHMVPMSKEELNAKTKAMRNGEIKMRREGCYWSPEEDEAVLFKYYKLFKSTTEIAIEHERNESGILQRIGILDALQYGNQKRPNRKKKSADPPGCLCKSCTVDRAFCPRCPHFEERIPPAMRVRRKKLYFCPENKPPDERAEAGSPTAYKLAHREVLLV